jgi:uncharacterized repeat protein (TIGR01451 family)
MKFRIKLGLWLLLMLCAAAAWCQSQAPPGTVIQNTAYFSFLESPGVEVYGEPSNTVSTTAVASAYGGVVLLKTANTSSASPGQSVNFTLMLSNSGSSSVSQSPLVVDGVTQQAIYVLDQVPQNTQFAGLTNAGGATVFYHVAGAAAGNFTAKQPANASIDAIVFAVPALTPQQGYSFAFKVSLNSVLTQNITNIASVTFAYGGQSQTVNSDQVTVIVPPTIAYYTDATFSQPATVASVGGALHVQAVAAACNLNPLVAETHAVTITAKPALASQMADVETYQAVETGPNTGIFELQNVVLADATTVPVVQNDGTLEVYKNEILTATIVCGSGNNAASATTNIVVDPYGVVFDSHNNSPVSGAQVTIIDVTGKGNGGHPGQPATVTLADGKTPAPNTVTTGTDGSYRFPGVATSTYKLAIVPPSGYKFPSQLSPLAMPSRKVIQPDSYGGSFQVSTLSGVVNFDVPLDEGPMAGLFVQKTPDENEVDSDSLIGYTLEVTNNTPVDLPNTTIVDTLPPGFMYQPHSATLNGVSLADPAGGRGPILTFSIGDLPITGDEKVHYYVRLQPQANNNNTVNTAYAASGVTRSNIARAYIKIIPGVFDTNGVIIGKVYADCNGNHVQDNNEPGIPGVRIYLDNGTFAITDEAGKYSIYAVTARLHGLRMDDYTLPPGFKPEPLSTFNAGDGKSLFVDMIAAELHRADFAVTGCSVEAMKTLSERTSGKGTAAASEAESLMKKSPVLDHVDASLEQRRGVATAAILDGTGTPKSPEQSANQATPAPAAAGPAADAPPIAAAPAAAAPVASASALTPAPAVEAVSAPPAPVGAVSDPAASSATSPVPSAPTQSTAVAASTEPVPAPATSTPAPPTAPVDAVSGQPESGSPQEPETKGGLRVEKLIRPGMTNDFDFLGLKDGQVLRSTEINVPLKGVLGTNFILTVNGKEISAEHIGQRSTENSINLQVWLYIGLELNPGSNTIEAKMFDPFGNERGDRKITVIAPGSLASVIIEPATRNPVADGKTPLRVRVRLVDDHGIPVTSRTPVTLETSVGKWDVVDLNPKEPGIQQFIEGGEAVFLLLPPLQPIDGKIAVSSGTISSDLKLAYIPELRPLMGVGVVDQTLSFRNFSGAGASSATFYSLQNELNRLEATSAGGTTDYTAHVGTFIKGRIWGDTLMTMSYDSDKHSGDPMFRDAQPDDYYLVYGDSSTRGFEAQSTSRLYLRFDRGKDYAMYGDYNTGDSQNPAKVLSNINRSFTGFRIHQQDSHFEYTAFTTRDSVVQYVEEIPGNGTSGPYLVTRMDLVQNSETVEILVRNRNQPSIILEDLPQTLLTDYEFDSLTGEIIFKQPVPILDSGGNPVSIRVTYEFNDGGPKYWMSGIDGSMRVQKLRIGGTYYDDKTPSSGMRLWGTNGLYEFNKTTTLVGEFARTWTPIDGTGDAEHFEFKQKNAKLDTRIYYGRTDASFDNPNAMLNKGSGASGANITYAVRKQLRLHFELIRSEATDTGAAQTSAYGTVQIDLNKIFSFEFGYRHAGEITTTQSLSGTTPTTSNVTPIPTTGTGSSVPTSANDDLIAKLTIKPPKFKKLSAYSEYEADMFDETKQEVAVGGTYQFAPKGKFYVRHELVSSLGNLEQLNGTQQQNSTVFGIDTTYLKDQHIFSEYRGIDAYPGYETEAAIGLRSVYTLRPGLKFSATAENVTPVTALGASPTDKALALTGSLDYTASKRWKSSGRFEWRQGTSDNAILSSFGLAMKLNDSYTLLNRSVYSVTMPKTSGETDRLQVRVQNGISFRPVKSNRFTVLTMFELKEEKDGTSTIVIPDRKVAILSIGTNYQPSAKTMATFRYAMKWSDDETNVVDSTLNGHMTTVRVTRDLSPRWNVGVENSDLFSQHFGNVQYANGVEVGYILRQNLWLSVGYNFTGFYDRDLTADEATRQGPFIRMRFKFDESMFPFVKQDSAGGH